jgi:pimeloyl-ACP methyl ester carboxylesterase
MTAKARPLRGAVRDGLMSWCADQPTDGSSVSTVILPGLGVARYLLPAARLLAQESSGQTVLVSPPGQAGSDHPGSPVDVAGAIDAVTRWVDLHAPGTVVVMGHSTGCVIAAGLGQNLGQRCARLVLASPVVDPDRSSWPTLARRLIQAGRFEHPFMIGSQLYDWALSRASLATFMRSCRTVDLLREVDRADRPTVVVRAEHDPMASYEWCSELAMGRLGGAARTFVTVPGLGHAFPYRQPDALIAALRVGDAALRLRARG